MDLSYDLTVYGRCFIYQSGAMMSIRLWGETLTEHKLIRSSLTSYLLLVEYSAPLHCQPEFPQSGHVLLTDIASPVVSYSTFYLAV